MRMKFSSFLFFLFGFHFALIGQSQDSICPEAKILVNEFRFAEAQIAYEKCLSTKPNDKLLLLQLSKVTYQLGQTERAIDWCEKLLKQDSTSISGLNQYAILLQELGKFQQALIAYQKIIAIDSSNAFFYRKAADLAYKIGDIEYAIFAYQECMKFNPLDLFSRRGIITIHEDLLQFEKSLELIDSALYFYPNSEKLWTQKAQIAYKMKKYDLVHFAIEKATIIKKDTSLWDKKIKGVAAYHIEKYEESAVLLKEVIEHSKASEVVYYYAGMAFNKIGNKDLGNKYINMAIKEGTSSNLSSYYTHLGVSYDEDNNYKDAIKAYQEAYRISKERTILYHLARNYDLYYKDKHTAMLYYEKFLMDSDSSSRIFEEYSRHRLSELKANLHFSIDTLN